MKNIAKTLSMTMLAASSLSLSAFASDLPGEGITVQPVQSTIAEETFQTLLVNKAMEKTRLHSETHQRSRLQRRFYFYCQW